MPRVTQETLAAFGKDVLKARLKKDWHLKTLKENMKGSASVQFLSGIENGKRQIGPQTVQRLIDALDLDPEWLDTFIDSDISEAQETQEDDPKVEAILSQADATGAYSKLVEAGITEKAIIRLAQRVAGDVEDVGRAWLELQNAMDIAVRVQADGHRASNHPDFVDEVMARVAALAAEGDYAGAGDEIAEALRAEDEAHAAKKAKLFERGIEVALLGGDETRAAELLVARAEFEAGGRADVAALRRLQDQYYEEGRDRGTAQPLALAIALSEVTQPRCGDADERGAVLNDLGVALKTLGERESGTERLEAAVAAYEAALEERTRERAPLDWAMTQMNLGNALQTLGVRESGTERLEAAVVAYEAALEERTRERASLDWAMTQMNLGNALSNLGVRESGTERLEAAVAAYEAALEEWTRERAPLDWAMTQVNLGTALQNLGELESGTQRLEEAVAALESALEEWTRERVPLQWAGTQMNLGVALKSLGTRESGTERLEEAVAAYEAVLEEYTRERVPLQWAMLQGNLASTEIELFEKTGDLSHLAAARGYVLASLEVFEEAQASQYVGMAQELLARIEALERDAEG